MIVEQNPSKTSPGTVYTTQFNPETGEASCNCRGWTVKKEGKPRECTHTRAMIAKHGGSAMAMAAIAAAPPRPPVAEQAPARPSKSFEPMLASAMTADRTLEDFPTSDWVLEEKFDGHRQVIVVADGVVQSSRSRAGNTRTLPAHIREELACLPNGVYDGELILPGGKSSDVTRTDVQDRLELVLFDILEVLGETVTMRTYDERSVFLAMAVQHIRFRRAGHTARVYQAIAVEVSRRAVLDIWARGGEGAILKRRKAIYRPGYRTADWVKVKKDGAVTVMCTGFQNGDTGIAFGRTLVRDDDGREFSVKTLNNRVIREVAANPAAFVGKRLVVAYTEKLESGAYRHPRFDHWAGEGE